MCHEVSVTGGAGGGRLAQCLRGHLAAFRVQARARMRARSQTSATCARLVKTASSGSFGFQGPGSHLIGSVQQFWLSIGGCGGRQWGWKT